MKRRVKQLIAVALWLSLSCLPEFDDDLQGGSGGAADTGACVGACCPTDPVCYPDGDIQAPGGECLATRDNRGKDRVQLRTTWTRALLPEAGTDDIIYEFLRVKGAMPLKQCNQTGNSGYILLFDWDRSSSDITEHTVVSGYAAAFDDGLKAIDEGLCFLEMMYSDPEHGWTEPTHIKPTLARRLTDDFDVDDPDFRAKYAGGEDGVFFYDDETGEQHGYAPGGYFVIHESLTDVFITPAHDVETRGYFNDPEVMNCQGRYRAEALDPDSGCRGQGQTAPAWGCDDCELGIGPTSTWAHFMIEELEKVHVTLLSASLCVLYMGQQKAIDEGWAAPDDWGLNCSGSPRWQAGERPEGDWCHATDSPATADCHDSWRSGAVGVGAAVNIQSGTCSGAPGLK